MSAGTSVYWKVFGTIETPFLRSLRKIEVGLKVHTPSLQKSTSPAAGGFPDITVVVGCVVYVDTSMTATVELVFVALPAALVAVTLTPTVLPASATTSVYDELVAPAIDAPPLSHW